jgi:hypothetical protein
MPKFLVQTVFALLFTVSSFAATREEPRNLFEHAEKAWAVGLVHLGKPLRFREGAVIAFPSQITERLWAPDGTKPRNLMLVYEVPKAEMEQPALQQNDSIFVAIRLLPEHAYWKDNLPATRRHQISGGSRYVFRGDDVAEVKKALKPYLEAVDKRGIEENKGKIRAVVGALESKLAIVREDAISWLSTFPTLARDYEETNNAGIEAYVSGDAPVEEKVQLVDALAKARVTSARPALEKAAKREDAAGKAAREALDRLAAPAPTKVSAEVP